MVGRFVGRAGVGLGLGWGFDKRRGVFFRECLVGLGVLVVID